MPKSTRLHHFDVIKGLAIFSVVMGHVLTMCIRDIDQAALFKIIGQIHMPLFFFISGYFTYKVTNDGKTFATPKLWTRFKQLIVPFLVVSAIWVIYFPLSGLGSPFQATFESLYYNEAKYGYWFTLVLFEIILIYTVISPLLRRITNLWGEIGLIICAWGIISALNYIILPDEIVGLYCGIFVFTFFPIFMLGVIAKKYHSKFDYAINNKTLYSACLIIGSVLLYIIAYSWKFPFMQKTIVVAIFQVIFHTCLIIVVFSIVKPWSDKAIGENGKPSNIVRCWKYLGVESLSIYLLHYFFLFPLTSLQQPLRDMALGFVPTFIVAFVVAAIIIAIVLLVNHIIQKSPLLGLILTGKIPRNQ